MVVHCFGHIELTRIICPLAWSSFFGLEWGFVTFKFIRFLPKVADQTKGQLHGTQKKEGFLGIVCTWEAK